MQPTTIDPNFDLRTKDPLQLTEPREFGMPDFYQTLLHMANTRNRTTDGLILCPEPYPPPHMLQLIPG